MPMPKSVSDPDFASEVLENPLPVVVDFWAPWCGPSKIMLPILEELETEYAGKVAFTKMNCDENLDVPGQYGIMSLPTFVIFKDGKPVKTMIGARSKQDMKKFIDEGMAA
jgi:thioredoxin 1